MKIPGFKSKEDFNGFALSKEGQIMNQEFVLFGGMFSFWLKVYFIKVVPTETSAELMEFSPLFLFVHSITD